MCCHKTLNTAQRALMIYDTNISSQNAFSTDITNLESAGWLYATFTQGISRVHLTRETSIGKCLLRLSGGKCVVHFLD